LISVEQSGQVVIQLEELGDGISLRVGAALVVAMAPENQLHCGDNRSAAIGFR
jgi:hypothetical protein